MSIFAFERFIAGSKPSADRVKPSELVEPEKSEPFDVLACVILLREKKEALAQLANRVQSKEELVKQQQAAEAALSNSDYIRKCFFTFWRIHTFTFLVTKEQLLHKSVAYLQTDSRIKAREIQVDELRATCLELYQASELGKNEEVLREKVETERARLFFEEAPDSVTPTFNELRRRRNHFHSRSHQWSQIKIEGEPFWCDELQMKLKCIYQTRNYGLDDEYSLIKASG